MLTVWITRETAAVAPAQLASATRTPVMQSSDSVMTSLGSVVTSSDSVMMSLTDGWYGTEPRNFWTVANYSNSKK